MLKAAAGPGGVFQSGGVYEVEDDLATAFVSAGAAVEVEPAPEPEQPPESPQESAAPAPGGLVALTLPELRAEAKRRGIDLGQAKTKKAIVALLEPGDGPEPAATGPDDQPDTGDQAEGDEDQQEGDEP